MFSRARRDSEPRTSPFKVSLFPPCNRFISLSLLLSLCHVGRAARGGRGAVVSRPSPSRRPCCPEGHLGREEAAMGGGPDGLHGRRLLRQDREEAQHLSQVASGKGQTGRESERGIPPSTPLLHEALRGREFWSSGPITGGLDRQVTGWMPLSGLCSATPRAVCATATFPPPSHTRPPRLLPSLSPGRVSGKYACLPPSWMRRCKVRVEQLLVYRRA